MVVYIEAILFINSIIHYNFFILTIRICKIKKETWRLVLSLILINIFMLLYLKFHNVDYFKYPFGIILSLLCFKSKRIISMLIYFALNFLLGGISGLFIIYTNKLYFIILITLFIIIFVGEIMLLKIKETKYNQSFFYDVMIDNQVLHAFLDSGNNLMIDEKPVIFLKKKIKAKYIKEIRYETTGGKVLTSIYEAPIYMIIDNKKIKLECYVAFSNIKYDCLLNLNILEQMEGLK